MAALQPQPLTVDRHSSRIRLRVHWQTSYRRPSPNEFVSVFVVCGRIFGVEGDADCRIELKLGVRLHVGEADIADSAKSSPPGEGRIALWACTPDIRVFL